jgi:hypothetical protein
MRCEEKARLTQEYEAATAKFAEAVGQLQRNLGTSTRPEYERFLTRAPGVTTSRNSTATERALRSQARLSFEVHIAVHDF